MCYYRHRKDVNRYLRIVDWAERRYRDAKGSLLLYVGQNPSAFKRIEIAAWNRYMNH